MASRRMERVNRLLLQAIATYVLENQPPDTGLLTFTAVSVTDDLMEARVYYSVMGSDREKANAALALDRMRTDLTRSMRRLESLKRIPEMHFVFDDTIAKASRVHELIVDLQHQSPPVVKSTGTSPS